MKNKNKYFNYIIKNFNYLLFVSDYSEHPLTKFIKFLPSSIYINVILLHII